MSTRPIISIVFCVERGLLEAQAVLLVESIKRLPNADNYQMIAFSPRIDSQPSDGTKAFFKRNQVKHIRKNLNHKYIDYPIANKVLACAYVESHVETKNSILFVDTDTVFINDLSSDYIDNEGFIYVRPVDNKGPGTEGSADSNDLYWQKVFDFFGLKLPDACLMTTVGRQKIRNYYNAGFIWSHKVKGFFQQWLRDFEALVQSGLRPFGYNSRDNTNFRCLDQIALAVTTTRYLQQTSILNNLYNYPIPFKPYLEESGNQVDINELVHVHYHKWFQHPGFLSHVSRHQEKQSEAFIWLAERLPIKPEISCDFKY